MRRIFDEGICEKIKQMKLLLIGVGGIGSECLKNLITIGCRNIDIIDIDTIDITNLNRQFLFKRKDVKKHKSTVAKERALLHKKDLNINAYTYDVCTLKPDDIKQYDYVINALDNIKARRYVNKLCVVANKVLIESGSTGFNGQVYPILANETKCYNCEEKPKPKTYAICTIRQTPTLPEHCVAWGKLIFETFFCKTGNETLEDIKNHIEKESKKRNMNKLEIAVFVFNYLFYESIKELIELKTDFTTKPIPIKYEKQEELDIQKTEERNDSKENEVPTIIRNEQKKDDIIISVKNTNPTTTTTTTSARGHKRRRSKRGDDKEEGQEENEIENESENEEETKARKKKRMKLEKIELSSQKLWNKEECIQVFITTFLKLFHYLNINKQKEEYLIFDKDDDDCMNFITAISNLRMMNFSIQQKSKFDIQSIAGNIIPAIASTNAIVAAFQAVELIQIIEYFEILKEKEKMSFRESKVKHVWIKSIVGGNNIFQRGNLINSEKLELPNPACYICQQALVSVNIKSFDEMTLFNFVKDVCINELGYLYPLVDTQDRNVFDYDVFSEGSLDYIKSLQKSLATWNIHSGDILILTDIYNSEEQLEIHVKHEPNLETPYSIGCKNIKKKVKNDNTNDSKNMADMKATSGEKNKHSNSVAAISSQKKQKAENCENLNDVIVIIDGNDDIQAIGKGEINRVNETIALID